jgi:hypothetical protein
MKKSSINLKRADGTQRAADEIGYEARDLGLPAILEIAANYAILNRLPTDNKSLLSSDLVAAACRGNGTNGDRKLKGAIDKFSQTVGIHVAASVQIFSSKQTAISQQVISTETPQEAVAPVLHEPDTQQFRGRWPDKPRRRTGLFRANRRRCKL